MAILFFFLLLLLLYVSDQVIAVGPDNGWGLGQYEYIVLSNWAKYPVIGLAKNINTFYSHYKVDMERTLRRENYMNFLTDAFGSLQFLDWSQCRRKLTTGNIVGNILHGILSLV